MRVFFFLVAFVITLSSIAQEEYSVLVENDDVVISYQVLEVKKKGALIPEIRFSIKNKSESLFQVSFEMSLRYDMEFIEATKVSKICIDPGKTKKGKIKGLFYNPESLTMAQLISDDFELYLDELKVISVAKCK